eukprot:7477696-Ditylum_brightwellii.AAC.1
MKSYLPMYEPYQNPYLYWALQNVFMRNEWTISDKYFDAFCQDANRHIDGGMKYVLTDSFHANLSRY